MHRARPQGAEMRAQSAEPLRLFNTSAGDFRCLMRLAMRVWTRRLNRLRSSRRRSSASSMEGAARVKP